MFGYFWDRDRERRIPESLENSKYWAMNDACDACIIARNTENSVVRLWIKRGWGSVDGSARDQQLARSCGAVPIHQHERGSSTW